jgi:hypothetical protein
VLVVGGESDNAHLDTLATALEAALGAAVPAGR